ncbi:hypothetical protein BH683_028260 [Williamsia sp. 1138]|jgi:hypothetical protein|nr:hypothetical protein BH683_028260 [Williamsia sp. 1138]
MTRGDAFMGGKDDWAVGYPDGGVVEFGCNEAAARTTFEMLRAATWTTTGESVRPRLLMRTEHRGPYQEVAHGAASYATAVPSSSTS